MTCRLTDIAGNVSTVILRGFTRSDPPKILVVEMGKPPNTYGY